MSSVEHGHTSPTIPPAFEGVRILLADDNFVNQEVVRGFLDGTSATLDVAKNGEAALELFSQTDYDLILMDVNMPVMDGLEATAALRRSPRGRTLPVVALTASDTPEDVERCYNVGMNTMLIKPIQRMQLLQTIAKQLKLPSKPTP